MTIRAKIMLLIPFLFFQIYITFRSIVFFIMTNSIALRFKLFLFIIGLFAFSTAMGAGLADTVIKKTGAQTNRNSYYVEENPEIFKDAVASFRSDSLEDAVKVLAEIFKRTENKTLIRILDYRWLELYNFMREVTVGNLDEKEKIAVSNVIRAAVLPRNESAIKAAEAKLKVMLTKPLYPRLKLFCTALIDNKLPGKEADVVLLTNPNLVSVNVLKAEWLYDSNRPDESIQICTKLISLSPDYAHAYELMGNNYAKLENPKKALEYFNQAIKLFPENKALYYDRGGVLMELDKYKEANTDLKRMYDKNHSYLYVTYNLAKNYNELRMLDSALIFINMHVKQYPNDDDGYDLKGNVLSGKESYLPAIDEYNRAIKISPGKEPYYEDRGDAYFYAEKYDDALTDFLKALKLKKTSVYVNDRIGDCYYQLQEYKKAIPYHQEAIRLDPKYKYAYVGESMSQVQLGNFKISVEGCLKAIAIDSTYDTALSDLGWIYYCNGDNDDCIAYSAQALKFNEKSTFAMFNIAIATLRKGEREKARELYMQFAALCKQKGYPISEGPVEDLRTLIKYNIATEECRFIIQNYFGKEP